MGRGRNSSSVISESLFCKGERRREGRLRARRRKRKRESRRCSPVCAMNFQFHAGGWGPQRNWMREEERSQAAAAQASNKTSVSEAARKLWRRIFL